MQKVTIASFHSFRPRLLADSTHAPRGVLFGAHILAQSAGITLPSSPTLVCAGWIPGLFSRGELGPINQADWQVLALHLANSKPSTNVCFIVLTNSPGSRQLDMVCETLKPPQRGPTPFPRIRPLLHFMAQILVYLVNAPRVLQKMCILLLSGVQDLSVRSCDCLYCAGFPYPSRFSVYSSSIRC